MNVWTFTGNLGNDCETRHLPNGDPIVTFSVGVKSGYGDKATTTWARCSMFGSRGTAVAQYLQKGRLVGVVGELSAREWTDKDGLKRTSIEVRVNDLTLLGKHDGGAQGDNQAPQQRPQPAQRPAPSQQAQGVADLDDDIPW